jgi:hypothetical protein
MLPDVRVTARSTQMLKNRSRLAGYGAAGLFVAMVATIIALRITRTIAFELMLLMLVALIGLYVGFGVLIAVWRFMQRLE